MYGTGAFLRRAKQCQTDPLPLCPPATAPQPTTQRTAAPWEAEEATVAAPVHSKEALIGGGEEGGHNNNYSRPQGQNVG